MSSKQDLRTTFNEVAEVYDRARPGYPQAMVDDLVRLAGLGPGSRVLEIGCGTGQLTASLAGHGVSLVGVELGSNLAAMARRNLARFPGVEVATAAFEEWPLPPEPFDLVVSATAFHWLDPAVRVQKSAAALRPGGTLAIIDTHHVAGGDEQFFQDSQECYLRWDPNTSPGFRLPTSAQVTREREELDRSPLFESVTLRRYEWDQTYSAEAYSDLLRTYSDIRALGPAGEALVECIARLIASRYGGHITKRYLTELRLARTRSAFHRA